MGTAAIYVHRHWMEKDVISEDESKLLQEEIQKLTDKYIKKIDDLTELKSKDILTV